MSYAIAFDTHDELVKNLRERLTALLTVTNKNRSLEVVDIDIPDFERKDNLKAQKAAKIQGTSYSVPVKATLVLKEDGKVLSRGKVKILDLPQVTTRGTYVVGGNEYSFPLQKRLIPGVYTREHDDGTVSAWLNSSKGANMSIILREGGDFVIKIGATIINLHAVLIGLGIGAQQLRQAWGEEVYNTNVKSRGATDPLKALEKLYSKLHYPSDPPAATKDVPGYRAWILNYFEGKSAFDPENVELTLGKGFSENSTELLMAVTQNILAVSRGDKREDNKESLIHNHIFDLSDFVIERLNQRQYLSRITRTLTRNMMRFDKVSEIMQKDIFQTPVESTFTQTSLGRIPKQTNPMDQMSSFSEITVMGEGGIGDVHAVTNDVRAVDPTHLGFIDLAHTPEGINIGTSLHLAHGAGKRGKNLINKVVDVKKRQNIEVTPRDFFKAYVAFPEYYKNGKVVPDKDGLVKAIHKGELQRVKPNMVEYAMRVSTDMFGVNTMGVPFLSHNNGTRVMTAAKMQSQAKPLKHREKPLILSALNEFTEATVEDAVGRGALPKSPVDGVVSKVTKETIVIKGKDGKDHSVDIPVDFWMNENNYTTVDAKVKVGDKVKAGDILGDSNYTQDGTLALGTNLRTAYVAYKGYNHEDATVISESAAEKLTSLHAYQKLCPVSDNEVLDKGQYLSYFPAIFDKTQIERLDDDGVIKPGKKVRQGDPLVVKMRKIEEDTLSKKLQNISRLLTQDYRDTSFVWDKEAEGTIAEVHRRRKDIMIVVKTEEKAKVGDKLCYDEKTEILTSVGWKPVSEVTLNDKVCTLQNDDNIEYINPDAIHKYENGGRMYRIKSQQVDLLVTEDHSMYVQKRGKGKTFELERASDIFGKRVRYKKNGNWSGEEREYFTLPEMKVVAGQSGNGHRVMPPQKWEINTFMMILGAFLSDGNLVNQPDSGSYGIDITQIKTEHKEKMLNFLDDNNVKYSTHSNGNKVRIYSKQLLEYLKGSNHCYEKRIPEEVFSLDKKHLEVLFEWMMWGDGHTKNKKPIHYVTTSKGMADDFQRLCLHIGKAANIVDKTDWRIETIMGRDCICRPIYDVRIINSKLTPQVNHGHVHRQNAQEEYFVDDYKRPVYCLTVPGHVLYVRRNGKPVWSGNCGRYGNKATITTIIPDREMPKDDEGNPMEILMNPDGVGGRMNLGQILETTASKISDKTGKPYIAKPFGGDYTSQIAKELKKNNLKDHGTLHDADGEIEGVLHGKQYVIKLEHQVEKKISGRGAGPEYSYTMDGQPARGSGESGRSIALGEMYALLAHGADANLKEMYTFKGDKQVEIWRAIEQGTYVPPPDMPFSSQKFAALLRGMGIDLQEKSGKVSMTPFLDRDIKKYSSGAIKDATAIRGKDLKEEKGGLFDFKTTGGLIGDKWSHIDLAEPMPHPSFEKSILDVTGLTKNDLYDIMSGKKGVVKGKIVKGDAPGASVGGVAVKQLLKAVDPEARLKEIKKIAPTKKGSDLNKMHREARVLRNFKDNGIKLEEMVVEKVPVVPPKFRPIVELPNGDLSVADVNEHYRALILMSQQLEKFKDRPGLRDESNKIREQVYVGLKGTMGFDKGLVDKPDVKGIAHTIAGRNPKSGYYQQKLLRRRQDLSGTGVVGPDPKLGMDELGVPENMAWDIFKPFIIKELRSSGFTSIKAREEIESKTKIARSAMQKVMGERLVMMNRAPTLHKFGLMAFKPKLVPGYQVKVPVEVLGGYNMDFDGDSVGIHVPASREALEEAKNMLPSNNLYSTGNARTKMIPSIGKEYMIGVYKISRAGKSKKKEFKTPQEAIKAAENKQIEWIDVVNIKGIGKTTAGRSLLNSFLPSDMRDYNTVFDDKAIQVIFDKVYKKHGREAFIKVIDGWKHAGRKHVYTSGSSFLLSDLRSITPQIGKIYDTADKEVLKIRANPRLSKKEKDERAVKIYSEVDSKVVKMSLNLPNNNTGRSNNITDMVDSGMSKPGPAQLKQLVGSVGLMMDHRNEVIPEPVRGNYADGLTSADFYAHMFSQRKGMIDRSRAVSGPGMLSKELTNTASRYKITEADCNTRNGRSESVDRHLLDKLLAEDLPGIPRDTTIDAEVLDKIIKSKRPKVKVRSILTCESGNGGMCAKCFGIDEFGNFPAIGKNVGITEIQAVTERSVQLPMKAFHTGGVASAGPGIGSAFDRSLQIFRMPENVKGKATLAELSGVVTAIRPSGYGGQIVTIGTKEHKVSKDRKLSVKVGDSVKKGDTITDGVVKPQELLKLKGIEAVQERMRDDLHDTFASAGVKIQKKTYELPVKMYTEQVRITDPGDCGDYVPGDHSTLSKVKGWNSKNALRKQIKYISILPGSLYAPMKTDDWAQRMALGRIQATLQEGAGQGLHSDRKGGSPFADLALGPGTRLKRPGEK